MPFKDPDQDDDLMKYGEEEEEETKKDGEGDDENDQEENEDEMSDYDAANEYDDDVIESDEDEDEDDIENEMKEGLEKTKEPSSIAFEIQDEDEDEDEDEEEEYEEDETYFQRFHENMKKSIVEDFHPEMKYHNYDEIDTLTTVIRDSTGRIIDPNHQTMPFITKYEKARILGERAKQINSGAKPMIEIEDDIIDGYLIAQKEFEQKKIPFIIKRPVSGNHIEYWKLSDLEVL